MTELSGPDWHHSREKRRMDIAVATGALPMAIAAAGVAAALITLDTGERPVFRQRRNHGDNQLDITKLKTYRGVPTNVSRKVAQSQGVELVHLGRVIRKARIDELPQLASVLRGDMSIVGPRAIVPCEYEETMDQLSPDEQNEYLAACKIAKSGMVYPKPRLIADGCAFTLRERAHQTIEYAFTASRASDTASLRECASVASTVIRLGLDTIAD